MSALRGFFDSYYRLRPVNATFTGVHEYDDRLPDWTPEGLDAGADEMRRVRAALIEDRRSTDLHDVDVRDRELAISFLDVQIAELETCHFQRGNPSLAIGEAAFGVIGLMTRSFAGSEDRARSAVRRLEKTASFLDGARRSMTEGIAEEWRLKALRECRGVELLLDGGIQKWIAAESIPDDLAAALTRASASARGGLDEFRRWLEQQPAAPANRDAAGGEFVDLLLTRGHWCSRDRRSLLQEARAALEEALAVLDKRARKASLGGWHDVQQRLSDAHPTLDTYLSTFQRVWDACRERSDACGLLTWPDYPIRYVPIPVQTRDAAPSLYYLFYRSPAPFDQLPMHDYVVTPIDDSMSADEQERRLRATNTSVITLNHVVHHGAIGHHVQNYYAYKGRSEIGRVAAGDCASRIGMFLGGTMAEGWACYATDLMDEHGFLSADESLAQQHTRARLLARAVVDLSLHDGSMSFDAAVALYRDRIGMSPDAARGEVCKNSMFPGTAVMYWLGTDGIHQLRRRVASKHASLREFHDRLLTFGAIPVPLISTVWDGASR
jgi:hypothetical protein